MTRRLPRTVVNGPVVRALRTARGLSQAETAQQAHLSPQYLCDIEAGRRKGNESIAAALAAVLAVAPAAVVTLEMPQASKAPAEVAA